MSKFFKKDLLYCNDGTTLSVGVEERLSEDEQGSWEAKNDGTGEHFWKPKGIENPNILVYSDQLCFKDGERYNSCTIRVIANVKLREKYGKMKKVRITIPLSTLEMKEIIAKSEMSHKPVKQDNYCPDNTGYVEV